MEKQLDIYSVQVRYRTATTCNTRDLEIEVPHGSDIKLALDKASEIMKRRKSVVKVDGGDARFIGTRNISLYNCGKQDRQFHGYKPQG